MPLKFVSSQKGNPLLILHGHIYNLVHEGQVCTWRCTQYRASACGGRVHTDSRSRSGKVLDESVHNHPPSFSGQKAQTSFKSVYAAGAAAIPKTPMRAMQRTRTRPNSYVKRSSSVVDRVRLPEKRTTLGDNVEWNCQNRLNLGGVNQQKEKLGKSIVETDFESSMIVQGDNLVDHLPGNTVQSDSTSIITVKEENMEEHTRDFFSDVYEQHPHDQILSNGRHSLIDERISSSGINIEEIQDEKQLRLIERREAIWQQRELHAIKLKIAEAEEKIVSLKLSSAKLLHSLERAAKA
ncbi:uncharacterized protein [Venturia canescens]|uniref:uncharacterized protein n=1 Tax=Venturia canescens TaxID=32260 RepID=UPI001C9D4627|nr:uncharacterized protein LOC122417992 [Venturia canescens]